MNIRKYTALILTAAVTASLLAGSAAAPQQQSMKWRTDESIDPNGEALARQRGDSSLRLPANTFVQ